MANEILVKTGTQILIANSTYNPTNANHDLGASITDDIDMVGLTADQAREGVKIDLTATRAPSYFVRMSVEFATTDDPVSGETVDLYWGASHSTTAAVGNPAELTGADADYAGYDTLTLAESLKQLIFIGSLVCGANNQDDGIQIGTVGVFSPPTRYGVLVVHNNTTAVFHSDSINMGVSFDPIIPEIQ